MKSEIGQSGQGSRSRSCAPLARTLLLLLWWASTAAAAPRLAVLVSGEGAPYQEVASALTERFAPGETATIVLPEATGAALGEAIAPLRNAEIAVTVGTQAAQAAARELADVPLLSVFIPKSAYRSLHRTDGPNAEVRDTAAIYLDQPYERQFRLLRELVPQAQVVGVALGRGSRDEVQALQAAAGKTGLDLHIEQVEDEEEASVTFKNLLWKSDAVLAVPDPLLLTPDRAKWLLYMAYRSNKPVVGFSAAYAEAGALAAVYSTPEQIGREAAQRVQYRLQNGTWPSDQDYHPGEFTVQVNHFVSRSLGLSIPEQAAVVERLYAEEGP